MSKIPIMPGRVPHEFSGRSRIGVQYEIVLRLSDDAYLNNTRSLAVIQKILAQVSDEMERRLTDRAADRTNFLDRMLSAKRKMGDRKHTLTEIASQMKISTKTLERSLDKHFGNIPGKRRERLRAALEDCEKAMRGKHFFG